MQKPFAMKSALLYIFGAAFLTTIGVTSDLYTNDKRDTDESVLIAIDFENQDQLTQIHQQFGSDHSFSIIEDPEDQDNRVGRFELRQDDPIQSNGKRSEILFPEQDNNERWYAFSVYLPEDGYPEDSNREIISQWHQSGGGPPLIALKVRNDRFFLRVGDAPENRKDFDLVASKRDKWHDFVFHIKHAHDSSGTISLWHNDLKVLTHHGGNMYDLQLPRWKVGVYKSTWSKRKTNADIRVVYFDNIKMGNNQANYEKISPTNNSPKGALLR